MVKNNEKSLSIIWSAVNTLQGYARGYASMHKGEMEGCQMRDQRAIPAQLALLSAAEDALLVCTHPEDIALWDAHVELAKAIIS